jgi:hypothetical protein
MIGVNYKVMEMVGTMSGREKFGATNIKIRKKGFDGLFVINDKKKLGYKY